MGAVCPVAWGFIGAGGVARRRMLPAVAGLPEVRIAAVMVRERARAEAIAAEFGADAAYDQVDAVLADPGVEAVYIATPPDVHEQHVCAAAAAGKHVLLEKPMALDLAACDRMLAAVAAAGVRLAVCFPLRHTAAVGLLKQWLSDGALGPLTYLRAQLAKWYPLAPGDWRADPARAGGGVIMDLGSHLLDLAWYLGGPIESVAAVVANRAWDVSVEDTAILSVRFASGALASLELSFAAYDSDNAIEVYGTDGVAQVGAPRDDTVVRRRTAGGEEELPVGAVNVYKAELLDFSDAVRNGREALTTGEAGRRNVACLEASYRSVGTGRREAVMALGSSGQW